MTNRGELQTACDSGSLWNFTYSPGWTEEDVKVLRKAIMKYGCGNWKQICRHFPNKTNGQLNLQTQRLFGQQSLAEFFMLHVDPNPIRLQNDKKKGPNILRKNDCIVNTGGKLTKKEREEKILYNKKEWELGEAEYMTIHVPIRYDEEPDLETVHDKVKRLSEVYRTLFILAKREQELKELMKKPEFVEKQKKLAKYKKLIKQEFIQSNNNKKMDIDNNNNNNNNSNINNSNSNINNDVEMIDVSVKQLSDSDAISSSSTNNSNKSKNSIKKSVKKSIKKSSRKRRKRKLSDSDCDYIPSSKRQRTKK